MWTSRRSRTISRKGRAPALPPCLLCLALVAGGCGSGAGLPAEVHGWDEDGRALLRSLWIGSLPPVPVQPSNAVADDPRAAALGHRLFFETGLSGNGEISCASCHLPELHFTDGRARSRGLGDTTRNAPTVVGAAWSAWQFWDGRRDSLWAQAAAPLESSAEMGSTRLEIARFVTSDPRHRDAYRELFGPPPDFTDTDRFPPRAGPFGDDAARDAWFRLGPDDQRAVSRAFSNVTKAIAAYERRLAPGPEPFDRYVEAVLAGDEEQAAQQLPPDALAGLRLLADAGRTQCLRCHNGPLLTNQSFHDVATARLGALPDLGRFLGVQSLLLDEFNCLGPYSDAGEEACQELRFLARREIGEQTGAFKTPTLRGVARTGPYLHDGSLATLEEVMEHYLDPPPEPGHELPPLELSPAEARQLVRFLETFTGGIAAEPRWLAPPPGSQSSSSGAGSPKRSEKTNSDKGLRVRG